LLRNQREWNSLVRTGDFARTGVESGGGGVWVLEALREGMKILEQPAYMRTFILAGEWLGWEFLSFLLVDSCRLISKGYFWTNGRSVCIRPSICSMQTSGLRGATDDGGFSFQTKTLAKAWMHM
jgi:hypothetical protein